MSITIDNEFSGLIPPLSDEEFNQLEQNCVSEGIRDALVTWNGVLVDGHNRYRIAQKHQLDFQTKEIEFKDRDDVKLWILRNQLGRRNLLPYVRAQLALKLKPIIAEKAKEQQIRKPVSQKSVEQKPIDTQKELATIAGVSHDTIHKVEAIEKSDNQFVKDRVKTGDMSINKAYLMVTGAEAKTPAQVKREFIESVQQKVDDFQEKKSDGIVSIPEAQDDKHNREILANNLWARCMKLGDKLDSIAFEIKEGDVDLKEMTKHISKNDINALLMAIRSWRQSIDLIEREVNSKQ